MIGRFNKHGLFCTDYDWSVYQTFRIFLENISTGVLLSELALSMNIRACLLFSCFCWFLARATQTSTAIFSLPKVIEFRPGFKELVQQANDMRLHDRFSSDSFDLSKSGLTVKTIYKAYSTFKKGGDVWSKTIKKVCREQGVFGGKIMVGDKLISDGLSRILKAEGVDINDIISKGAYSNEFKISQVFSKVLNCYVPNPSDNLLPSVMWLFLRYFELFPEKKTILCGDHAKDSKVQENADTNHKDFRTPTPYHSSVHPTTDKKIRPEFLTLVQEAFERKLDDVVGPTALSLELTPMGVSIREKYFLLKSKDSLSPWGRLLKTECRKWKIFGSKSLKVNEIIPVALSRILKAEGVDINELIYPLVPIKEWAQNNSNVNNVFSKILSRTVFLKDDEIIPSVLRLIMRYKETFPDKSEILFTKCEEERKLMGDSNESEQLPSVVSKRTIPDAVDNENTDYRRRKVDSNNNSNSSYDVMDLTSDVMDLTSGVVDLTSDVMDLTSNVVDLTNTEEPTIPTPKIFEFRPEFKKIVQTALNCRLHILVTKNSLKISTSKPTDQTIYEAYLKFKTRDDAWSRTIEMACKEQSIFGGKVMLVNKLVDIGLTRILKAEGVDIRDIISEDSLSYDNKISQVFSKVLDTSVATSKDNLISSATWLFLEYSRSFPEKKVTLWGGQAEEAGVHVIADTSDRETEKGTSNNSPNGMFYFRPEFKELVQEAITNRLDDIVSGTVLDSTLTSMEASIRKNFSMLQKKGNPRPWVHVLRLECRQRNIFGPDALLIEQLIPVALSRILKAEGVDVNNMLPKTPISSWYLNSRSIPILFSTILNIPDRVYSEVIPSLLWLILRYHEEFPDKHEILLKECDEEIKLQKLCTQESFVESTGNLKRKLDSVTDYEITKPKRAKKEVSIPNSLVSLTAPPPALKHISNNSMEIRARPSQANVLPIFSNGNSSSNNNANATSASNANISNAPIPPHVSLPISLPNITHRVSIGTGEPPTFGISTPRKIFTPIVIYSNSLQGTKPSNTTD